MLQSEFRFNFMMLVRSNARANVLVEIILLEVWSVAVAKYVCVHQKYAFVQLH
jgi:hypothetical protein